MPFLPVVTGTNIVREAGMRNLPDRPVRIQGAVMGRFRSGGIISMTFITNEPDQTTDGATVRFTVNTEPAWVFYLIFAIH